MTNPNIYAGRQPAEIGCYSLKEAAHHLQLPLATVRSWVFGRRYPTEAGEKTFHPLLKIADPKTPALSFHDLVELHVLGAIRREHQVHMPAVRKAIAFLRKTFDTQYPLSSRAMLTDGKDLFIEHYGKLVSVSEQGQMALKEVLELYLKRIDRSPSGLPIRLFPYTRADIRQAPPKSIVIDPRVQFGRPCLVGTGITTSIIVERYRAGESVQELANDYRCETHGIEEAIRYETAT